MVRLTPTMKCKIREAFGDLHPAQEMPPPRKKVDLQQWTQTAVAQKKSQPLLGPSPAPVETREEGQRRAAGSRATHASSNVGVAAPPTSLGRARDPPERREKKGNEAGRRGPPERRDRRGMWPVAGIEGGRSARSAVEEEGMSSPAPLCPFLLRLPHFSASHAPPPDLTRRRASTTAAVRKTKGRRREKSI